MKIVVTVLAAAIALAGSAARADTVLTFDDVTPGYYPAYHGDNFADYRVVGSAQYPAYVSSAPNKIMPVGTVGALGEYQFSTTAPARFKGMDVIGCSCASIYVNLYIGGTLVHHSDWHVFADNTPEYLASGYSGAVDKVGVYGRAGYWALDNIAFASGTPEPGEWAMMIGGMAIAGGAARRRRALQAA